MEILFLLFALGFAVSFFGLGIMFANYMTRKIPNAPRDQKSRSGRA